MFTIIDHHSNRTHTAPCLASARAAIRDLPDATVCDQDGVIRATTRNGVSTPRDEHGFPERTAHEVVYHDILGRPAPSISR